MINAIINGIMSLIISLVSGILYPIDALINRFLPSVGDALGYVGDFFETLGGVVPFVLSYTGISLEFISICVDLIVFVYTLPLAVHAIKLAIKWYQSLKL